MVSGLTSNTSGETSMLDDTVEVTGMRPHAIMLGPFQRHLAMNTGPPPDMQNQG